MTSSICVSPVITPNPTLRSKSPFTPSSQVTKTSYSKRTTSPRMKMLKKRRTTPIRTVIPASGLRVTKTQTIDGSEAVQVAIRCRPLLPNEKNESPCVTIPQPKTISLKLDRAGRSNNGTEKIFTFEHVFESESTQEEIYQQSGARDIVSQVLNGYNATIFAYGQTSSGKTHTMTGDLSSPLDYGIIPRTLDQLFDYFSNNHDGSTSFLVTISILEIYNEQIRDLLGNISNSKETHGQVTQSRGLDIREHPEKGFYVKGLTSIAVTSRAHALSVIKHATKQRQTSATRKNQHSSRSHAVLTLTVERTTPVKTTGKSPEKKQTSEINSSQRGQLVLVDLAGSERIIDTFQNITCTPLTTTNINIRETAEINKSLSALGNVIVALAEHSAHIPYRDSKLTKLLRNSLGGNAKTLLIATISPSRCSSEETLSTLEYAARAKKVENRPIVNEDPKDMMIRRLQEHIGKLAGLLKKNIHRFPESDNNTPEVLSLYQDLGFASTSSNITDKGIQKKDAENNFKKLLPPSPMSPQSLLKLAKVLNEDNDKKENLLEIETKDSFKKGQAIDEMNIEDTLFYLASCIQGKKEINIQQYEPIVLEGLVKYAEKKKNSSSSYTHKRNKSCNILTNVFEKEKTKFSHHRRNSIDLNLNMKKIKKEESVSLQKKLTESQEECGTLRARIKTLEAECGQARADACSQMKARATAEEHVGNLRSHIVRLAQQRSPLNNGKDEKENHNRYRKKVLNNNNNNTDFCDSDKENSNEKTNKQTNKNNFGAKIRLKVLQPNPVFEYLKDEITERDVKIKNLENQIKQIRTKMKELNKIDPLIEFFYITATCVKISENYYDCNLTNDYLFEKAKKEEIEFYDYYNWLKRTLCHSS